MCRICGRCLAFLLGSLLLTAADASDAAIEQMQAGHFDRAAELLRPIVQRSPRNPDLWNLLGVCESELNHPRRAETAFREGLRLASDSTGLHENLGLFYFRRQNYRDARIQLEAAVHSGSRKPDVRFSLAATEIRTGEERRGLALLREIEPALSDRAEFWTERGWVELKLDPDSARSSFDHALALDPNDPRALNGAASDAEAHAGDEEALSFLVRARKAHPDDLRTLLHFASVCLRKDLAVDAAGALARARTLAPANNLAIFLSAQCETVFQHWQKALDLFIEFDRRAPNYAPAQYAMGWLYRKLNRPDDARAKLERSLRLDPALADARCEWGELELSQGNREAAEASFARALQVQPRHVNAAIGMGDVSLRQGRFDDAQKFYEQAIRSDPRSGPAHYKLSTVLLRKHEAERAAGERALGTKLNEDALRASKTVLRLSEPDGRLLSESPAPGKTP